MDENLIKLVNRLQDTFSNLGACPRSHLHRVIVHLLPNVDTDPHDAAFTGGELDMPQLVVVGRLVSTDHVSEFIRFLS